MQAPEPELGEQYEPVCESTYSEAESAAAEVLDLPLPSYFRSRSHSYLRAIQAGCSQEDDTGSVRSISPPPTGSLSGSRTLPTNSSECSGVQGTGDTAVTAWGLSNTRGAGLGYLHPQSWLSVTFEGRVGACSVPERMGSSWMWVLESQMGSGCCVKGDVTSRSREEIPPSPLLYSAFLRSLLQTCSKDGSPSALETG